MSEGTSKIEYFCGAKNGDKEYSVDLAIPYATVGDTFKMFNITLEGKGMKDEDGAPYFVGNMQGKLTVEKLAASVFLSFSSKTGEVHVMVRLAYDAKQAGSTEYFHFS